MNEQQGFISFEVGGATRRLVFDTNTLCTIEDAFGCSIEEIGDVLSPAVRDVQGNPVFETDPVTGKWLIDAKTKLPIVRKKSAKLTDVRTIFWCALVAVEGQETLTKADAGHYITELGAPKVMELVQRGFEVAFPDKVQAAPGGNRKKN